MSWDVIAVKDMDKDEPIASRDQVLHTLETLVPDGEHQDSTSLVLHRDTFSLEISLGNDDPVKFISYNLRASQEGDRPALELIQNISQTLHLHNIDCQEGEELDIPKALQGLQNWRDYVAKIQTQISPTPLPENPYLGISAGWPHPILYSGFISSLFIIGYFIMRWISLSRRRDNNR